MKETREQRLVRLEVAAGETDEGEGGPEHV